jgi:hypothetical protein
MPGLVAPGTTVFTVMLRAPSSRAQLSVKLSIAFLAAEYKPAASLSHSGCCNDRSKAAYGECALIERRHEGEDRIRPGHHIGVTQTRNDRHRHIGTLRLKLGLQLLSVKDFV